MRVVENGVTAAAAVAAAWRQWQCCRRCHCTATALPLRCCLAPTCEAKDTRGKRNCGGTDNNHQPTKRVGGNGNGTSNNDSNDKDDLPTTINYQQER
jgi:hypothetical protein